MAHNKGDKKIFLACSQRKHSMNLPINRLTPNDPYSGRTAPLTSKRCILYIYSTNIGTEYFKHGIYSPFFPLQNAVCFIILTYLVPVLFTFYIQGVLKLKKNNSGAKTLTENFPCRCVALCRLSCTTARKTVTNFDELWLHIFTLFLSHLYYSFTLTIPKEFCDTILY